MAYTRDKLPIVYEDGNSTLNTLYDYDFGLTTTAAAVIHSAVSPDNVAFTGMGLPSECCNIRVTPPAAGHEEESDAFFGETQSYPSPRPTQIDTSCFAIPAAQHQHHQPVQENPYTSLDPRAPAFVPAPIMGGNRAFASHPLVFHNTTPAVIEDQLRAKATPAALLARHALQTLGELGAARVVNDLRYPLTGPDTFPENSLVFVQEHPYHPGMGLGGPSRARGERRPSMASSRGSTLSATTERSASGSFECSFRPCKRNNEIATFRTARERNKHEQRVHGPEEERPHGCHSCRKRFNHPREVERHFDAKHSTHRATAVCLLCPSSFKHRWDHLVRHLESSHPEEWPAIKEAYEAEKRSVSSWSVANPMTPSTASVNTLSNEFGLLTPPPSRGSYRGSYHLEFPCLPPSPSRT